MSADLVVLSILTFFSNPKICIVGLIPVILVLHRRFGCFPFEQSCHVECWASYICQFRSSFQYYHRICWWFSSLMQLDCCLQQRSTMNRRCKIKSPWRLILYPMLLVFISQEGGSNNSMESNPDRLSPWNMPVLIKKWSVLIWPSWWLRCKGVFHLFNVFLRNFDMKGRN